MATRHTKSVFTALFEEQAPALAVEQQTITKPAKKTAAKKQKPQKLSLDQFHAKCEQQTQKKLAEAKKAERQQRGGRRSKKQTKPSKMKVVMKGLVATKVQQPKPEPQFDFKQAFGQLPQAQALQGVWASAQHLNSQDICELPDNGALIAKKRRQQQLVNNYLLRKAKQLAVHEKTAEAYEAMHQELNFDFYDQPDLDEEDLISDNDEDEQPQQDNTTTTTTNNWWGDDEDDQPLDSLTRTQANQAPDDDWWGGDW